MLYGKKTLIFEEVTVTLLSNEIRKILNQEEQEGLGLVIMGRKERGEGKKSLGSSKACHFCQREGHWKKDYKHGQEWLKKKRKTVEAA